MFNLFGRKTVKEFEAEAEETYAVPEVEPPKKDREFYRVGRTEEGRTTLTMISTNGYGSMTLTMTREACEQMIRMLESTFTDDPTEEEQ